MVDNESDAMLTCLVVLVWASSKMLLEMAPTIGGLLEELSEEGWHAVMESLQDVHERVKRGQVPRSQYALDAQLLPENLPPRAAVAFSLRLQRVARPALYERYLRRYTGTDLDVLQFIQNQAFELARKGGIPWDEALKLVRDSYAAGVVGASFAQLLTKSYTGPSIRLSVAEEIIENAEKYPTSLVTLAESRCRAKVAESIVPVGKIAEAEQWFS